jgi:5-methylcytosine-specific restriction endonuclease McrA
MGKAAEKILDWKRGGGARYPRAYRNYRAEVLAKKPKCWNCDSPATTLDHIKQRSKGGSHDPKNLRPACGSCNFIRNQYGDVALKKAIDNAKAAARGTDSSG